MEREQVLQFSSFCIRKLDCFVERVVCVLLFFFWKLCFGLARLPLSRNAHFHYWTPRNKSKLNLGVLSGKKTSFELFHLADIVSVEGRGFLLLSKFPEGAHCTHIYTHKHKERTAHTNFLNQLYINNQKQKLKIGNCDVKIRHVAQRNPKRCTHTERENKKPFPCSAFSSQAYTQRH